MEETPSLTTTEQYYNNNNDDEFSSQHELYNPYALALIPKLPALISIVCACVFIHEVLVDMKTSAFVRRGDKRVIPNMLLVLSISDVILGLAWFSGSLLVPKGQLGFWSNVGNTGSCVFGGFLMQYGIVSSPLCNIGLSFYYLLIVKYNWRDAKRMENFEKLVHLCIWTITIPLIIVPIIFEMYNFNGVTCWLAPYPLGCNDSSYLPTGDAICLRGEHSWIVSNVSGIIIVGAVIICGVIMAIIYVNVRKLEDKISKYHGSIITSGNINNPNPSESNRFDEIPKVQAHNISNAKGNAIDRIQQKVVDDDQEQRFDNRELQNNHNNFEDVIEYSDDNASSHMDETEVQDEDQPVKPSIFSTTQQKDGHDTQYVPQNQQSTTTNTSGNTESLQIQAQRNINREKSKRVAIQGMWYIGAFLLTYTLAFLSEALFGAGIVFVPVDYAAYVMLPLQGFFSFYAFCRTRAEMKTKGGNILKQIIINRVCCSTSSSSIPK